MKSKDKISLCPLRTLVLKKEEKNILITYTLFYSSTFFFLHSYCINKRVGSNHRQQFRFSLTSLYYRYNKVPFLSNLVFTPKVRPSCQPCPLSDACLVKWTIFSIQLCRSTLHFCATIPYNSQNLVFHSPLPPKRYKNSCSQLTHL